MLKRCMDIFLSGLALLVFLPFGLTIALILRCTGEGEVFYVQNRVGKAGKDFGLLKFATMLKNSPNIGTGFITTRNDPRVLPFGSFLRKTKLNEMPQLINILKGDMSVIGPRPIVRPQYEMLSEDYKKAINDLRPGLSGIGSIVFRDEEKILSDSPKGHDRCYQEDILPLKIQLELWYTEHASLWLDCLIILATIWAVLVPSTQIHKKILGKEWDLLIDN